MIIHLLPEIDQSVWAGAGAAPTRKPARKVGRGALRGPQPNNVTVPDSVVLAMRYRFEIDRWTTSQVIAAYPEFSSGYVRKILGYILRSTLKPQR